MRRREALLALAAITAGSLIDSEARALGRTPTLGRVRFSLPWPLDSIDPADPLDPAAALFAHVIADPLYALDGAGEPYPALAAEFPETASGVTTVRLREGLVSARGVALVAQDVVHSIERARRLGGAPLLADLPAPRPHPRDRLAVVFATTDRQRVARALATPAAALVPRTSSPVRPDGTGAMRADLSPGALRLTRNPNAARGASYLEEIVVEQASDLSSSLRSFETGVADVGWLGAGLHTPRARALPFDLGAAAWIVLRTGNESGAWGAPGVAQRIADALPPERIQHLGLGPLPAPIGDPAWQGPPGALLFAEGSAQLGELARTLASIVSRPGHEVRAEGLPSAELARRRASGNFLLMAHVVRPIGGAGVATLAALAGAQDPRAALAIVRRPPRLTSFAPRIVTRTLRLGVVGELRVMGAHAPDLLLARSPAGEGWDLGATHKVSRALG